MLGRFVLGSRLGLVLATGALGITLMWLWLTGYWLLCHEFGKFFRVVSLHG
jgi:hypothetical protein